VVIFWAMRPLQLAVELYACRAAGMHEWKLQMKTPKPKIQHSTPIQHPTNSAMPYSPVMTAEYWLGGFTAIAVSIPFPNPERKLSTRQLEKLNRVKAAKFDLIQANVRRMHKAFYGRETLALRK